ncbi:hypothetical protein IDM33_01215 [Acinetobacter seifertii]|nr:hypothetical protein [Acinetobacter seifertii]
MYTVKALEPQLNDIRKHVAIVRDDDALVGHFYHHEHAEIACEALNNHALLNAAKTLKEPVYAALNQSKSITEGN